MKNTIRSRTSRRRSRRLLWILAALLAFPAHALAAECGEDVAGGRVACACGDVLISDLSLHPGDPLVQEACATDGLIVDAAPGSDALQIDLGGLTIRGSGMGTGLLVLDGGEGGARITGGDAIIQGFMAGLRANRTGALAELSGVRAVENAGDGVVLRGRDVRVTRVFAVANGRDGIRLGGRDYVLDDVDARANGRRDVVLASNGAAESGAEFGVTAQRENVTVRRGAIVRPDRPHMGDDQ